MLKIHTLTLGMYQTNTYIIHDDSAKTCCVIDPGYEPQAILDKAASLGLQIEGILLTHGHFDHVGAVAGIAKKTGCSVWMNQGDYSPEPGPMGRMLLPLANCKEPVIRFCQDREQLRAAGLTIFVRETPGHTRGGVCYLCEDALFSGDTLFAGACGRTDLGGDWPSLLHSLKQLAQIEADLRVFPGHGESTTLAAEKRYNPYMV